jgi:nitroreductase
MITKTPLPDLIRRRKSVRTYSNEAIPGPLLNSFRAALDAARQGPLGSACRFAVFDTRETAASGTARVGSFGFIRGARWFFTGAVRHSACDLEDFGYLFESLVLQATDLGLGTCWLGASFDRRGCARLLGTAPDEQVPAASPLGLPAGRPRTLETAIRLAAGSRNRKPAAALFFDTAFGRSLDPAEAGPAALCLEMVRLAPSARNRQPWRILKEGSRFHFFLQRAFDKGGGPDLARVDMGIALCHFDLTARYLRLSGGFAEEKARAAGLKGPANKSLEYIITWKGKTT